MKTFSAALFLFLTCAKLGTVQAASAPEMAVQNGPTDVVNSIHFSRDSSLALSVTWEELKLWNPHTGELIRTWIGQPFGICDAEFSPDGRTIVMAGADKGLSLWDVATGRSKGRLTASASCGCLKFSPDGKWLLGAIGSSDSLNGGIFVWNWQNHQLVRTLQSEKDDNPLSRGYFTSDQMGISRGGDQVWLRTYGHLTSWHFPDGKRESVTPIGGDDVLVPSPDGKTLASMPDLSSSVELLDRQSKSPLWSYNLEDYMAHSLTFSQDGSELAVTSSQGNVLLFIDAKTGRLIRKWGNEQNLETNPDLIAFSADGQQVAYGIQNAGGIHFASWPKVEQVISGGTTPSSMRKYAVSSNGRILVCLQNHRSLTVWDLVQGKPIRNIQLNAPGRDDDQFFLDLELSPDAGTAYVQSFEELRAVSTVSGTEIWRHSVASTVQSHSGAEQLHRNPQFTSLSLSNDGKVLLSLLSDGPLRCWEARTGRWLLPTNPGKELQFTYNQSVLASPDGKWAAVSGMEEKNFRPYEDSVAPLRLIDVKTQQVVREIPESHGSPMQFSPNGKTLLVLENSGQLTAYDTPTLKKRWRTPRITIGFFESENKLLCVESDGKISERSVSSGKILKSWTDYSRLGFGAIIQKIGPNRIIGATWNHTLGIWDLKTHRKILDLAAPGNSDHNGIKWLAYTPDNFYNGSPGIEKFLRWRTGTRLESGEKWQSQFRSPEKVKAALAFNP